MLPECSHFDGKECRNQESQYYGHHCNQCDYNTNIDLIIKAFDKRIQEYCELGDKPSEIKDLDDVHDWLLCADINGTIMEQMNDDDYYRTCDLINQIGLEPFQDIVDEYRNPYDPFREHCDADFYGV